MKIALICTEKLPVPPIAGGAVQLYIAGILPVLSKHHEITVFGVKHPELPEEEVINGVKYIRVDGPSRGEYIRNIKAKLTDDFDLIHVFNRPRFVLALGEAFPWSKISLSLHNEMFDVEKITPRAAEDCINRVEFITTVSKFIAEGVKALYPSAAGKLHPVYSGADVKAYKPSGSVEANENKRALKLKYGIENKKVVLFVGRLSEKKGVDKLLLAMKKVMDLRKNVALVIIGSKWYGSNTTDDYTKSIQIMAENLAGPIIFTGFLPPSDIPRHYNIGDVFVCPSQWNEPLARVHYEAMAAGLPIITTNRGGNAEVVKGYDNGIVLDDFSNTDLLASYIMELLDNDEKAEKMGQAGRTLAEQKYDFKRVADDLLRLINGMENKIPMEKLAGEKEIEAQPEFSEADTNEVQLSVKPAEKSEVTLGDSFFDSFDEVDNSDEETEKLVENLFKPKEKQIKNEDKSLMKTEKATEKSGDTLEQPEISQQEKAIQNSAKSPKKQEKVSEKTEKTLEKSEKVQERNNAEQEKPDWKPVIENQIEKIDKRVQNFKDIIDKINGYPNALAYEKTKIEQDEKSYSIKSIKAYYLKVYEEYLDE